MLADVVLAMPYERRAELIPRFIAADELLGKRGLKEKLFGRIEKHEALLALGHEYFRLGIACPFLEEESCSIHPDRPVRCREILVTSPAEHCADPDHNAVHTVETPARASNALMRMDDRAGEPYLHWVPLVLALRWAAAHDETAPRPGTEWLQRFLQMLGKGSDYEG